MRSTLTEHEIEHYRTNGFVAIDDLLSASELTRWREGVDAVIAGDLVRPPSDSSAAKSGVFDQRMNLRRVSATMKPLVEGPEIGRLVAELEGIDAVRVYLDQALVKEPYGAPTQFHQDLPWWPFDSSHACTIWIALDDATVQNGCLYFVPGSHRLDFDYRSDLGSQLGAIFAENPQVTGAPIPGPIPAGGCSFHNARTIHGAGANMTPGRRRAMTVAFMPDGVTFDGTRDVRALGERYLDSLAVGDPLSDDDLNPLVYAREPSVAAGAR